MRGWSTGYLQFVLLALLLVSTAIDASPNGPGGNGHGRGDVRRGRGNDRRNNNGLPQPRPQPEPFSPRVGQTPTDPQYVPLTAAPSSILGLPTDPLGSLLDDSAERSSTSVPPTEPSETHDPTIVNLESDEAPRPAADHQPETIEVPVAANADAAVPEIPFPPMEEDSIRIIGDLRTDVSRFQADSYPPALRAFLIALIGSANLVQKKEMADFDYLARAVNLSIIMKYLVAVYSKPLPYNGPPIKDLATYKALTDPTDGLTGTVTGNYDSLLEQAQRWDRSKGTDIRRAYAVDLESGKDFDTQLLHQAARYITELRARHMLSIVLSSAASLSVEMASTEAVNRPLTIVETLATGLGQFLVNMTRSPGSLADMMRSVAGALERRNEQVGKAAPVDPNVSVRVSDQLRQAAEQVDRLGHWGTDQTQFLTFLQSFANADPMKIKDIIQAFEAALVPAISELRQIGSRVVKMEAFSPLRERDKAMLTHLKEIFNLYPQVLSERQLREILWSLIQNPNRTSDMAALELVLKKAGPMLLNVVQHAADKGGNSPLADMFKQFQGNNQGVPTEVIVKMIKSDPTQHEIVAIQRVPAGTGKFFQFHEVELNDGSIEGLRVRLPGAVAALEEEYDILTSEQAIGRLARIIIPGRGDIATKVRTARKLLEAEKKDLDEELDVPRTVENQTLAAIHLTKSIPFRQNGQQAVIDIRVPTVHPVARGSKMMRVQMIRNPISAEAYRADYPDAARRIGSALLEQFYDGLVIHPIEAARTKDEVAEGFGHRDLHSKNILLVKAEKDANNVTHYIVYLTDFGLAARLPKSDAESLMLLAVGANLNHPKFITDALWALSLDSEGEEATRHQRYNETQTIVEKTVKILKERKTYFSVGDWITRMYSQGYLDFDPSLPSLHRGQIAVQGLFTTMGHTDEELEEFTARYFDSKRRLAIGFARSQYPLASRKAPFIHPRNAARWARAGATFAHYSFGQCARTIAMAFERSSEKFSPLEAMDID